MLIIDRTDSLQLSCHTNVTLTISRKYKNPHCSRKKVALPKNKQERTLQSKLRVHRLITVPTVDTVTGECKS